MRFAPISGACIKSSEGYLISKYIVDDKPVYVSRCPEGKILASGEYQKVKAACEEHLKTIDIGTKPQARSIG